MLTDVRRGPYLTLLLSVAAKSSLENYFKSDKPIFEASFEPVHPWRICGPPIIPECNSLLLLSDYSFLMLLNKKHILETFLRCTGMLN